MTDTDGIARTVHTSPPSAAGGVTIGLLRTAKRGHLATSSRAAPCVSDAGTGDEADDSEPYHVCAVAANADHQTAPQLDGRRGLAAAIERGAHRCHLFLRYIDCHPSMEAEAVLRDRIIGRRFAVPNRLVRMRS